MERYYSIKDVATMTGLTTRTLRNYLNLNILCGEKNEGTWQFSEEDIEEFMSNASVQSSIKAKNKSIVYDFLINDFKKTNEICLVLDIPEQAEKEKEIVDYFCEQVSALENGSNIQFVLERQGKIPRIILRGNEKTVMMLMNQYYQRDL